MGTDMWLVSFEHITSILKVGIKEFSQARIS